MAAKNSNGVMMRDLMQLQEKMYQQQKAIYEELTNIKVKMALLSAAIAGVTSFITNTFMR